MSRTKDDIDGKDREIEKLRKQLDAEKMMNQQLEQNLETARKQVSTGVQADYIPGPDNVRRTKADVIAEWKGKRQAYKASPPKPKKPKFDPSAAKDAGASDEQIEKQIKLEKELGHEIEASEPVEA